MFKPGDLVECVKEKSGDDESSPKVGLCYAVVDVVESQYECGKYDKVLILSGVRKPKFDVGWWPDRFRLFEEVHGSD